MGVLPAAVSVFSTCPQSKDVDRAAYLDTVVDVARWSEEAGCEGILVYSDNGLVDAWLLADRIVGSTQSLCPLVAVQPIYMHPYTAAKMVATIGHLHGRRLYLNVIAGGFRNDLLALDDPTPHDERYDRATEYTLLVRDLLARDAVTFEGAYYTVRNLSMSPGLAADLQPGLLFSGSSSRAPLLGLLFSGSSSRAPLLGLLAGGSCSCSTRRCDGSALPQADRRRRQLRRRRHALRRQGRDHRS